MSGKKISELTALTIVAEGDTLPIVDISGSITGKATVGQLLTTQHSSYVVWNDIRVPLVGRAQPGAGGDGPTLKVLQTDGAGSEGVHQWAYPANADKWLHFSVELPHTWLLESELRPHMHWAPSTGGSGNVIWGLEYTIAALDASFGTTTIITVTDAAEGSLKDHYAAFSAISMVGITGLDAILLGRIYRDTGGSDTYGADAFGLDVGFHHQADSIGSAEELTK